MKLTIGLLSSDNKFNFYRLFWTVEKLNKTTELYTYSDDALEIAKHHYNEQQSFLRKQHHSDTFMSGIIMIIIYLKYIHAHVLFKLLSRGYVISNLLIDYVDKGHIVSAAHLQMYIKYLQ